jgi:ERCC4-related helicase
MQFIFQSVYELIGKPVKDVIFQGSDLFKKALSDLDTAFKSLDSETTYRLKFIFKQISYVVDSSFSLGTLPAYLTSRKFALSLQLNYVKQNFVNDFVSDEVLLTEIQHSDVSPKLWELIYVLDKHHKLPSTKDKKCLIFVMQKLDAEALETAINLLAKRFFPSIKAGFLTGALNRTVLFEEFSIQRAKKMLQDFNTGLINTLIATRVAEEGIDMYYTC